MHSENRRDRKRLRTLEHLARTAASLFEAHGYEAVTMEQIAMKADVAKGTLYNHFSLKEAVLAHWLHIELADRLKILRGQLQAIPGFTHGMMHVLSYSAKWCEAHSAYLPPYLRFRFSSIGIQPSPSLASEQLSDIAETFHWLISRGQASKEIRPDLDAARLTIAFHFLYLDAMLRWLADPRLKLRKEFSAAVELFLHGAGLPAKTSAAEIAKSKKRNS